MAKIFIVEDDLNIRQLIEYALTQNGFESKGFEDAPSLYQALEEEQPDLFILDIMLPGEDGYSILRRLKSGTFRSTPVIMLTAKTTEYDKVKGLDMGADDYISKPFGIMELVSRIKAVLRRYQSTKKEKLSYKGLELDLEKREFRIDGELVELTYKEFELLTLFMENLEMVLSRDQIMNAVWETEYSVETRTVDVHIQSLRRKLGKKRQLIQTIRNVGYKMK